MQTPMVLIRILAFVLLAALSAFLTGVLAAGPAQAQEKRSFFEKLFGSKPSVQRPALVPRQRKNRPKASLYDNAQPYQPARPAIKTVQKNENARRVLIVGDFVAAALAEGLAQAYHDDADSVVIAKTEGSSGFVRGDYYNWPARINDIIKQEKPDIIVVMLGANDRQTMQFANKSLDVLTPEWTANYRNRLLAFTETLQKSGFAWIWLSLPAFKQPNLNQTVVDLNGLYKQATEKQGGHFVDTWEGFVDENGNFALSGYDVNGQMARLRANDGINFTPAGRRKLAFYAEQAIHAFFGDTPKADSLSDEPAQPASPANIQRIAPVSLWHVQNQNPELAGATLVNPVPHNEQQQNPGAARYDYHRGRADDFSLSPRRDVKNR